MWPAIWPLAIDGLGRFTKIGAALLIMGIVGGAVLPPCMVCSQKFLIQNKWVIG
jgi:fucose permease